jgi:hypothetical protein
MCANNWPGGNACSLLADGHRVDSLESDNLNPKSCFIQAVREMPDRFIRVEDTGSMPTPVPRSFQQ